MNVEEYRLTKNTQSMSCLEMAYYLQLVNILGELRHPKYDSFEHYKKSLYEQFYKNIFK